MRTGIVWILLMLAGALAPTADAAFTSRGLDYTFTGVGDATFYSNLTGDGNDAAQLRDLADADNDGQITEAEKAEAERQLKDLAEKDKSSPTTFFDNQNPSTDIATSVTLRNIVGATSSTTPIEADYKGKLGYPSSAAGDSHTFKKLTSEKNKGPVRISAPPSFEITSLRGLSDPTYSSGKSVVVGTSNGEDNIEATFTKIPEPKKGAPVPGWSISIVFVVLAAGAAIWRKA
jgi:hypothetical protein